MVKFPPVGREQRWLWCRNRCRRPPVGTTGGSGAGTNTVSISSPPRRPRDDRDQYDDDWDGDGRDDSSYWSRQGSRIYASVSAPFRLGDGKHRLRAALLLYALFFSLFAARPSTSAVRGDAVARTAQELANRHSRSACWNAAAKSMTRRGLRLLSLSPRETSRLTRI